MNISVNQLQGSVPVTILGVEGDLDASNYQELIARAKEAYDAGTCHILLDLSQTRFISSSGLVAIHSIALMLRGERPLDLEQGWSALHAVAGGLGAGRQPGLKFLNPQPRVNRALAIAGLDEAFEIYIDQSAAIASWAA